MTDFSDYLSEEYFSQLYNLPDNSPDYSLVQGRLYDELREDLKISEKDAADVARYLNRGKVDEAEKTVKSLLEQD